MGSFSVPPILNSGFRGITAAMTPFLHHLLLFLAALAAGAINSVAGGGTLLTYPALLAFGVPYVDANATSTVALVPGSVSAWWGYRDEMGSSRRELLWMGVPSLLGGFIGARSAATVSNALFGHLVPWLIFLATALFMIQEPVRRRMARRVESGEAQAPTQTTRRMLMVGVFQFFVALYGGFFGAGIGILMLAALGFLGMSNIHRMNGLKNFAAVCINGVGALTFIAYHRVHWPLAALMAVGAILGGLGGAGLAQRIGQQNVRRVVIGVGLSLGVWLLVGQVRHL